jgi:predicted DNA-binding WGR domain protein
MPRLERKIAALRDRTGINPFTREPLVIPGRPAELWFFEVEQRGKSLHFCSGGDGANRSWVRDYADEDAAYAALGAAIVKKRRGGYQDAGPCRTLEGARPRRAPSSSLLIDVYGAAEDERFLDEVLHFDGAKKLATLAKPWFEDARPFARRALLAYVDDGCDRPGHKALVKRVYKLAEGAKDGELIAHFMAAFDRLNRRALVKTWAGQALQNDPSVPDLLDEDDEHPVFTRRTRRYLARRAYRYFRSMGYRDPAAYRRGVCAALALYRDEHLSTVGRLLSAWGLMHVLYGRSTVLDRRPSGIVLSEGRTLAELEPAPIFPSAWEGAFEDLFDLLHRAQSRPVRAWTLALLRAKYQAELSALPLPRVKPLLLSRHEEAQVLGVDLLGKLRGLDGVALDEWLALLGAENLEVLAAVCERAEQHVSPSRLTLAQCLELAASPAAPLAELGLNLSKQKKVESEADLGLWLRVAKAPVAAVRAAGARHCRMLLGELPFARSEHVRDLVDAPFVDARAEGLSSLRDRFGADVSLWLALTESPYPDVRSFVVAHARAFSSEADQGTLQRLFGTVMASVYGAGRDKRRVAREIAERLAEQPAEAPELLPLLSFTLRSVHAAERRLALSVLAQSAVRRPEVRSAVESMFPELRIAAEVSE